MSILRQPFFKKSKKGYRDRWGLLKNRYEYFGFIGSDGYLTSDPGEMKLYEGITFSGKIHKDIFEGEGELKHIDGITIAGTWSKGKLVKGKILLKDIKHIKFIEIDSREIHYAMILHNDHKISIQSGFKYKFKEGEVPFSLSFKILHDELFTTLKTKRLKPLLSKKQYKEVFQISPSLRLSKHIIIENSKIMMDVFANYKVSYCIEDAGNEIVSKIRSVFYTNGTVFFGKSSYRKHEDEPCHMAGILVDLDEYLLSSNPKSEFPYFDKFLYTLGKSADSQNYFINRFQISEDLLGLMLDSFSDKKNILEVLLSNVMSRYELTFDWNEWNADGYFQIVINGKSKFVYKNRISKGMNPNFVSRELENFNWHSFNSQDYFHHITNIQEAKTFY